MKWTEGNSGYENPEPGSHLARCCGLIDLGTQIQTWKGKDKKVRQVRISFELPYTRMKGEFAADLRGEPFVVHLTCNQSLNEKAKLRKLLEGWRGKRFTPEELKGYDPHKLIGVPARLSLVESDSGYINIDSISRVTKKEEEDLPGLRRPAIYFSLEEDEFDQAAFESLSNKTQEKIMETPEWKALVESRDVDEPHDPEPDEQPANVDYDDIPF